MSEINSKSVDNSIWHNLLANRINRRSLFKGVAIAGIAAAAIALRFVRPAVAPRKGVARGDRRAAARRQAGRPCPSCRRLGGAQQHEVRASHGRRGCAL